MDQGGGLEGVALAFVFHVPAGHQAQFGIDVLRQPPRAASSPPLQAFNRLVISAEGASMDSPFSPWDKKYTTTVAAFAVRFRLYQRKENRVLRMISSRKTGGNK